MAINLYGNVSGTYQKPNIDLFEMARKQNNQPVKFCDTEAGKNLPAIKVNISEEGLRALHGSKMKGSVDIQKQEMQYISEHQPVESFTNRLSRVMQNSYVQFFESNSDEKLTIQKKADVLLGEFKSICDEINSGYDGGTRVRFIEDSTSTDGFRKLSKDDELSILLSEFSNFVEGRFGKTHQEESEKVAKIVNDLQKVKQEMGRGDIRYYEPEYIPSDFVEKLLKAASDYIKAARMSGMSEFGIIIKHIIPNIAGIIVTTALLDIGHMMMEIAGLSFLGLGAAPPAAEWGAMMSNGRSMLQTAPWIILAPGVAIFVSVLIFNMFGESVKTRWNKNNRRTGYAGRQ